MRKNKTYRLMYKIDKQLYSIVKAIIKNKNLNSIRVMVRDILDKDFIQSNEYNDNFALWIYSQNTQIYKNTESYYISLTKKELMLLNSISKTYGISTSEIVTKIYVYLSNKYVQSVDRLFSDTVKERYSLEKEYITFYTKIDRAIYDLLQLHPKYINYKKVDILADIIDNANSRIENDKISLLRDFSNYKENSSLEDRVIFKTSLRAPFFHRILKNAYEIGETPYSLFQKVVYTKTKEIKIV